MLDAMTKEIEGSCENDLLYRDVVALQAINEYSRDNTHGGAARPDPNYPLGAFIAILVIEEIGKLSRLPHDLFAYDQPRHAQPATLVDRDHRRKHFIGVMSGALINARLDRVLGKDVIRRVLHEAESDVMERTRQACLYVDMRDGHPARKRTPGVGT